MNPARYLKQIAGGDHAGCDLEESDAYELYCAILDGGVPDLELGALLTALHVKGESAGELLGFQQAVAQRMYRVQAPSAVLRPVVIASYGGAREQPNLLALLAMMLARFGVPVLIHGALHGAGRIATAYVLRELGVMPSPNLHHARKALAGDRLAFVPLAVLCPGLAAMLALRERLGMGSSADVMVRLLDPVEPGGLRLAGARSAGELARMREFLAAAAADALLLPATEGEAFADPKRRPQIERFQSGGRSVLFEAEAGPLRSLSNLPPATDAAATAAWIRRALAGEAPVPLPLVNQLACCLYASGYTQDLNQAKAIVAVETGSLAAA